MNFSMSVTSTTARTSNATQPEMEVTCTGGKFKLNNLATTLLGVESGNYVAFVSNMDAVNAWALQERKDLNSEEVRGHYQFGVMKGYEEVDASGKTIMTKDRKTGEEIIKCKGAKCASINNKAGIGQIVEFTDAKHYPALGGNTEMIQIFKLDAENVSTVECEDGEVREFFPIVFDREEAKQEKKKN